MELDLRYRWYTIVLKDEYFKPCTYYFRGLTANELRVAGIKPTKFEAETFVLKRVVYPVTEWDKMLAGVCLRLLKEIYKVSGLDEEGLTFAEAVNWIQSENGSLEAAAVAMIPGCTLETLGNADPFDYARYLVMGKFQFETMYGVPVEKAFLGRTEEATAQQMNADRAKLGHGDVGHDVTQFQWTKGQAINIDPNYRE